MSEVLELGDLGKKRPRRKKRTDSSSPPRRTRSTDTPKRRRKKPNTEVAIVPKKEKRTRRRKTKAELEEKLDAKQGDLISANGEKLIESFSQEQIQDNEQLQEYISMFRNLQKVCRIAQGQYYKSKMSRDIYALMQVYNQMRDIIADLRALKDVGQLHETINDEVLQPLAQSTAGVFLDHHQTLKKIILSHVEGEAAHNILRELDEASSTSGHALQQAYVNSLDKSFTVLSEV